MSRIVIALGGNALGNTPYEQLELVTETAKPIVDLIEAGNEVIIAHGNGPQVGMINLAMSAAAEAGAVKSDMPFPECGAMSQGYIGYHLQNAIGNELAKRGINKPVATIVTQVLVDENDGAFQKPTKPIGAFFTKEQADYGGNGALIAAKLSPVLGQLAPAVPGLAEKLDIKNLQIPGQDDFYRTSIVGGIGVTFKF